MKSLSLALIIILPKELLVRWARDVYVLDESQITGTVELVTDSTFEVGQVIIQGFPRQIPDGDPNRIDSLVVPGPAFPGMLIRSNSLHCILFTLKLNLFVSDVHTFLMLCSYCFLFIKQPALSILLTFDS